MKTCLKKAIMRRVMKKRKASADFDDVASEIYVLPPEADETVNNSYYYASHDKEGNAFFMRLGIRGGTAEIWFGVTTACGKAYMNSQELYKLEDSPVKTKCIQPLKEWEFSFKGKMLPVKPGENRIAVPDGKEVDAEFSGTFTSDLGLFEFSRDTHVEAYANAIAAQKWVKGFSDELKNNHQTRTEQMGHTKAVFKVGGKEFKFDAPGLRDRAYGKRIWSYMNHYSWLVGNLEDGRAFNACMVLYPAINVKGLRTGYYLPRDKYINLLDVDFPKHFTVTGVAPTHGKATAKFSDKTKAEIEFETKIIFPYRFTDSEGEYLVFEGVTSYTFNGIKGYGIAEFSYNKDRSRYENF
ncbi:MAG: hypothetical protein FWE31_03115 [Firmicutes bacterium]|nr:hypothetical protein [Bacillota bacterium]